MTLSCTRKHMYVSKVAGPGSVIPDMIRDRNDDPTDMHSFVNYDTVCSAGMTLRGGFGPFTRPSTLNLELLFIEYPAIPYHATRTS